MSKEKAVEVTHPKGEVDKAGAVAESEGCTVDTYAGKLRIRWDDSAAVTALSPMPVFVDFLKTSGLWDGFVADCPLRYTSPNAPSQVDVLGRLLMSVLAGQSRYAHITGLRGDGVNPELLGMRKVMSEDSARRAFKQASAEETLQWLRRHLRGTYEPLLEHAWVMDLDSTVKPLDGKQEKAVIRHLVGCTSHKDSGMFRGDSFRSVGSCGLAGFSPISNKARHHGALAGIAFVADLMIQTGRIMATLIPALLKVGSKLTHFRRPTMRRLTFGKLTASQPAPNSLPFDFEDAADGGLRLTRVE
jgi:hypothetical protein